MTPMTQTHGSTHSLVFFKLQSHQTKQSLSPAPAHSQELTRTPELCPFLSCHRNSSSYVVKQSRELIWLKSFDVLRTLCYVYFWKTYPVHCTLVLLVEGHQGEVFFRWLCLHQLLVDLQQCLMNVSLKFQHIRTTRAQLYVMADVISSTFLLLTLYSHYFCCNCPILSQFKLTSL